MDGDKTTYSESVQKHINLHKRLDSLGLSRNIISAIGGVMEFGCDNKEIANKYINLTEDFIEITDDEFIKRIKELRDLIFNLR